MPKCTQDKIDFGRLGRRRIEADFSGGDLSSDGGLLLLRQVSRSKSTPNWALQATGPGGPPPELRR